MSAGGGNVDIVAAAEVADSTREPRQLCVLCGRDASPLVRTLSTAPFCRPACFFHRQSAKTVSSLPTRSSDSPSFSRGPTRPSSARTPIGRRRSIAWSRCSPITATTSEAWKRRLRRRSGLDRPHSSFTVRTRGSGQSDLESKFTEAALGHLQIADYRNFAHGRHHWLAKRSETSAILAFIALRRIASSPIARSICFPADIPLGADRVRRWSERSGCCLRCSRR